MELKWRGKNWTAFAEFYEEECSFENGVGNCGCVKVKELSDKIWSSLLRYLEHVCGLYLPSTALPSLS
jgi:hypothetical protein